MGSRKQISKIAVLGTNGMLGFACSRYYESRGYNVVRIDRDKFDVLKGNVEDLEMYLEGCDFVVNCIGVIKPRISSMKPEEVLLINGLFPKNLAKLASKLHIPCFQITTDCVYSGQKGNYTERDYFDIDDMYGMSKNAGENSECMTIRTSIIGEEIKNKYSLLEWAKSQAGKVVTGFTNHSWNGVTTLYLAEIIENIVLQNKYQEGLFHIFSPKSVTKSELLKLFNKIYKLSLTITETQGPSSIDRTLSSIYALSSEVANKHLEQQITEMQKFFSPENLNE